MGIRKPIKIPNKDEQLAELIGIILGDGNIFINKDVAQLRIVCNSLNEKDYLINFIKPLIENIFGITSRIVFHKTRNGIILSVENRNLIEFLISIGLMPGNKVKNQVTIPCWIRSDNKLLAACIRGLIDTDGSVFRMSKRDFDNPRIQFKNFNKALLEDVRNSLIELGFHPSKIIYKGIFLSRLNEVRRFSEDIKFHNSKNVNRLVKIAPWCSGQAYK